MNNDGYALILTILILTLFSLLAVAFSNFLLTEIRITTTNHNWRQAYFHAVAGAESEIENGCINYSSESGYNDNISGNCNNPEDHLENEDYDAVIKIADDDNTSTAYMGNEDDYIVLSIETRGGPPYRIIREEEID